MPGEKRGCLVSAKFLFGLMKKFRNSSDGYTTLIANATELYT